MMVLAAIADTHAAQRGAAEDAGVLRILEVRDGLRRIERLAEAQVLRGQIRIDDLAGIHLSLRIEDCLEFAKRLHEIVAEHFRQELGLRLPVAVLAGERPAVADDEIGSVAQEPVEFRDAVVRLEIEVDPRMHAALPEMAVEVARIVVPVEERAEIAQVVAEPRRAARPRLPSPPT